MGYGGSVTIPMRAADSGLHGLVYGNLRLRYIPHLLLALMRAECNQKARVDKRTVTREAADLTCR